MKSKGLVNAKVHAVGEAGIMEDWLSQSGR